MGSLRKSGRHDYYDICKKLLQLTGQWPYQEPSKRLFRMSVIIVCDFSILAVQIAKFYTCETTQCFFRTLPMHLTALIVLVKLLTCYFNMQKIKDLMERLHADWNILETQEEWQIMKRYAKNSRWYASMYISYVYICTIAFGSTALIPRILDVWFPLNESRPVLLPCEAYYFVDEAKYFYYMFFHLQLGAAVCVAGILVHDCTFLTYVEHVCGLFAVVGFRFEQLLYKRNITEKCSGNFSVDVYVKNIVFSINAHQRALQFAIFLENSFSASFTLQILIVVIGMSSSLIQISEELHGDLMQVMRYFLFVVGQLLHLLLFSFQGQKLINHSLKTREKIYNGLWYELPVKSQKMLLFTIRKSMEAVSLSAGKIYIFSLETFTSVMQCSVSYFTVLSSFNEP